MGKLKLPENGLGYRAVGGWLSEVKFFYTGPSKKRTGIDIEYSCNNCQIIEYEIFFINVLLYTCLAY